MADLVFNIAKGRAAELYNRVDLNDPTNAVLLVIAINAGAATDATLRDYDTMAAIEGDANAAEVTNSGYARKTLTDADWSPSRRTTLTTASTSTFPTRPGRASPPARRGRT